MTDILKELDEVLALQARMVLLRCEKEERAAESYQRQFQYGAAKYVRDHAPTIRAALELQAKVDAVVRDMRLYAKAHLAGTGFVGGWADMLAAAPPAGKENSDAP